VIFGIRFDERQRDHDGVDCGTTGAKNLDRGFDSDRSVG
jgi:hypothetical protein